MQHAARDQQESQGQQTPLPQSVLTRSTPPTLLAQKSTNEPRYGITTFIPPIMDGRMILPRPDDVSTILRTLGISQVSAVVLTGDSGAGKSTLAAQAYRQLQAAAMSGYSSFRHFIWLGLGSTSSIPDCLAALLGSLRPASSNTAPAEQSMSALPPDFMHWKPERQMAFTMQVLRQPQASSLVVFDQFEELLHAGTGLPLPGRGATSLFFQMLKQDLGSSRILLTCYRSPFGPQNEEESRAKACMISRISLPEGLALLQQRGVAGSPQELSLVWQRCAGNVYGLTLFSALFSLSGFALSYLLNAPDYQFMWDGDVALNLVGMVYNFLNPLQRTLLRALCLFNEPISMSGILAAISGLDQPVDTAAFERELAALARFALVQYHPAERTGRKESTGDFVRYYLHPRIRQYTIEHYLEGHDRRHSGLLRWAVGVSDEPNPMNANPEAREVALAAGHMRVATYYARLAHERYLPQEQRHGPLDVAPLLAVIEHLCLGWHWQQAYDMLLEEKLHERLAQWGTWNTLIRLYTAMISPSGIVARSDEAFICGHLGLLYGRLGDYQTSDFYIQQALATQREINDTRGEATTLINQGELLRNAGQSRLADETFKRARQLLQLYRSRSAPPAEQTDNSVVDGLESALLHNMGLLAQGQKDYEQALKYYLEALRLARALPQTYNLGMILTNTGLLYFELGRLPEALSLLSQAVQVRQDAQDPTLSTLLIFLQSLEQKMGAESFAALRQQAERLEHPSAG